MRITILAKKAKDICLDLQREFEERGHLAEIVLKKNLLVDDDFLDTDLVIQKSKKKEFLFAGIYAKAAGIPVIPDPHISAQIRDRVTCHYLAEQADILTPFYYFGYPQVLAEIIPAGDFPLVLKYQYGSGTKYLSVIRDRDDLLAVPNNKIIYLANYIEGDHFLVVYLGDEVRMYFKRQFSKKLAVHEEVDVPPEVKKIIKRWRSVTGLPLGDLDLVREGQTGAYWSVDPGSFPSFKQWPGVVPSLADLFLAQVGDKDWM